jgi:outer membrane receptor for ferrienterochelin and colicin
VRFGGQFIRHQFRPGAFQSTGNTSPSDNQQRGNRIYADEASLYAEDDYKITERLKLNAGVR